MMRYVISKNIVMKKAFHLAYELADVDITMHELQINFLCKCSSTGTCTRGDLRGMRVSTKCIVNVKRSTPSYPLRLPCPLPPTSLPPTYPIPFPSCLPHPLPPTPSPPAYPIPFHLPHPSLYPRLHPLPLSQAPPPLSIPGSTLPSTPGSTPQLTLPGKEYS